MARRKAAAPAAPHANGSRGTSFWQDEALGFKSTSQITQAPQPVYRVRLTSPHGDDIRRLRWALKALLRRLGLRCLSIEEEARQ
jgi:hypothetical protein